jgi:hypothetical protein
MCEERIARVVEIFELSMLGGRSSARTPWAS